MWASDRDVTKKSKNITVWYNMLVIEIWYIIKVVDLSDTRFMLPHGCEKCCFL